MKTSQSIGQQKNKMQDNIKPQEGIYLCGKEMYLIWHTKDNYFVVQKPERVIEASPYLFRFEEPISKGKIKELFLNAILFQEEDKKWLLNKGLELLSSQSSPKCT